MFEGLWKATRYLRSKLPTAATFKRVGRFYWSLKWIMLSNVTKLGADMAFSMLASRGDEDRAAISNQLMSTYLFAAVGSAIGIQAAQIYLADARRQGRYNEYVTRVMIPIYLTWVGISYAAMLGASKAAGLFIDSDNVREDYLTSVHSFNQAVGTGAFVAPIFAQILVFERNQAWIDAMVMLLSFAPTATMTGLALANVPSDDRVGYAQRLGTYRALAYWSVPVGHLLLGLLFWKKSSSNITEPLTEYQPKIDMTDMSFMNALRVYRKVFTVGALSAPSSYMENGTSYGRGLIAAGLGPVGQDNALAFLNAFYGAVWTSIEVPSVTSVGLDVMGRVNQLSSTQRHNALCAYRNETVISAVIFAEICSAAAAVGAGPQIGKILGPGSSLAQNRAIWAAAYLAGLGIDVLTRVLNMHLKAGGNNKEIVIGTVSSCAGYSAELGMAYTLMAYAGYGAEAYLIAQISTHLPLSLVPKLVMMLNGQKQLRPLCEEELRLELERLVEQVDTVDSDELPVQQQDQEREALLPQRNVELQKQKCLSVLCEYNNSTENSRNNRLVAV